MNTGGVETPAEVVSLLLSSFSPLNSLRISYLYGFFRISSNKKKTTLDG
jgi:hypothetical protein